MNLPTMLVTAVAGTALTVSGVVAAAPADAAKAPAWTRNCTALHHRFPDGVGKLHAHDHTSGTPVTDFRHSTRLYKKAMRFNKGLDRDKDKIACEA